MNKFDEFYSSDLDGWGFGFRRSQIYRYKKYMRLLSKIDIQGNILEIGCGTGIFTNRYLWPKYTKNSISGIDISEVAIKKARRTQTDVKFKTMDLSNLTFDSCSFDLITLLEVLYYLPLEKQAESLNRIKNLLVPNGYLLISVNIGRKPYYSVAEIENMISSEFHIIARDSLYIKSYYRYIETKLWNILELISANRKYQIKSADTCLIKYTKKTLNLILKNPISLMTYGRFLRILIQIMLYFTPISLIQHLSFMIRGEKERSGYIILAQKQ